MVDNWRAGSREAGQLVGSVQGTRTTGGQGPGKADNWWAPHLLGASRFSLFSGSESMLTMYAQPVENCKNAKQAPASDMPERVGQKTLSCTALLVGRKVLYPSHSLPQRHM